MSRTRQPELNNYILSACRKSPSHDRVRSPTPGDMPSPMRFVHSGHLGLTGIFYGEIDNDVSCVSVEASEMTNCKTSCLQQLLSVNPTSDRKNICEEALARTPNKVPYNNAMYTKNTYTGKPLYSLVKHKTLYKT